MPYKMFILVMCIILAISILTSCQISQVLNFENDNKNNKAGIRQGISEDVYYDSKEVLNICIEALNIAENNLEYPNPIKLKKDLDVIVLKYVNIDKNMHQWDFNKAITEDEKKVLKICLEIYDTLYDYIHYYTYGYTTEKGGNKNLKDSKKEYFCKEYNSLIEKLTQELNLDYKK